VEERAYPRVEVVVPVEIDVEPGGITTSGNVVNLSRSGLLASVHHRISVGQHCVVRFLISEDRYSTRSTTVVRSDGDESRYLVSLQFDSPLPAAAPGSESLFPAKFPRNA